MAVDSHDGHTPAAIPDDPPVVQFRQRLREVIRRSGLNRSTFAKRVGIDRSTLSQILAPGTQRLPRVDTLRAIAKSERVSIDWLVGLSEQGSLAPDIVRQNVEIERGGMSPSDELLAKWHRAAAGYKIRYVPAGLPDLLRADEVIDFEFRQSGAAMVQQRQVASQERLAYQRRPETDMEACSPIQSLEVFARGEGQWRGLSVAIRRKQLERMQELADELYPTFRWFLYDAQQRFSIPFTVFGPQRVAIYVGGMYLVLNSREHIRVFTDHFDGLIRDAIVRPHELGEELERLLRGL
jgi:transcriptional regulator with XRE-family HTH domain